LLARLGVEDPSVLENAVAGIPSSLCDVVEKLGNDEYELCFRLTHLARSKRAALGMGEARALFVRFSSGAGGLPPSFCIHLHPEPNQRPGHAPVGGSTSQSNDGHQYWPASLSSLAPDKHFCRGNPNRTTYQLNRTMWRLLRGGCVTLDRLYHALLSEIDKMASLCVVCGTPLEVSMSRTRSRGSRSATCKAECAIKFAQSDARSE